MRVSIGFAALVVGCVFTGSLDCTAREEATPSGKGPELKIVASSTVDAFGATLSAGHTGSPIDDVAVRIPPGALDRADVISLGYRKSTARIRAGKGSGTDIVLSAKQVTEFKKEVAVEVPYDPRLASSSLVIPYEIDEQGRLHVMDIGNVDKENHRLTVNTFKPVAFTLVYP